MPGSRIRIGAALTCCFFVSMTIAFLYQAGFLGSHGRSIHSVVEQRPPNDVVRGRPEPTRARVGTEGIDRSVDSNQIAGIADIAKELTDASISDLMNMQWMSRAIDCDFADREKVAAVVAKFPVTGRVSASQEQLDHLRTFLTALVFHNGNDDYTGYYRFLKDSGETVIVEGHEHFLDGSIADPWKQLAQDRETCKRDYGLWARWKGLVAEGSEIRIFDTNTPNMPLAPDLQELQGNVRTFSRHTQPPISFDQTLKAKGQVMIAEIRVFIAHNDETGGAVWPYMFRYWFDPVNNAWRLDQAALFQDPKNRVRILILP